MPRAHLCTSCGEDLALIAPEREPHYGWPMIRCPACRAPSVRWEGHERRTWRRFRKRVKAVAGVLGRIAVFALLTILTLSTTGALSEETRSLRMSGALPGPLVLLGFSAHGDAGELARASFVEQRLDWFDAGQNIFLLAGWSFAAFLAAVFLAALLRHRRAWITVPAWGVWMFAAWTFVFVLVPIIGLWLAPQETHWQGLLAKSALDVADIGSWCAAFAAVALGLTPLAFMARSTVRALIHRQRWRIRKRIRKWRQTA